MLQALKQVNKMVDDNFWKTVNLQEEKIPSNVEIMKDKVTVTSRTVNIMVSYSNESYVLSSLIKVM